MTLNIWLTQGEEEDVLGELDNILAELEGEAVPRCNIDILILIKASILKHLDGLSLVLRPSIVIIQMSFVCFINCKQLKF